MLEQLFENPGKKIKRIAVWGFAVESIGAVISGIVMMAEEMFLAALLAIIGGIATAFLMSLAAYAFGELVDSTTENRNINERILRVLDKKPEQQAPKRDNRATAPWSNVDTGLLLQSQPAPAHAPAPAAAGQEMPIAETPVAAPEERQSKSSRTLKQHLSYALRYSSVQGTRDYLRSAAAGNLTEEDKETINRLLQAPDSVLNERIWAKIQTL